MLRLLTSSRHFLAQHRHHSKTSHQPLLKYCYSTIAANNSDLFQAIVIPSYNVQKTSRQSTPWNVGSHNNNNNNKNNNNNTQYAMSIQRQQYRSYVFLPSSFSEWMQSIRSAMASSSSENGGKKVILSVRLRNSKEQMKNQFLVLKKEWLNHILKGKNRTKQKLRKDILEMKHKIQEIREKQKTNNKLFVLKTSSRIINYILKKQQQTKSTLSLYSKYNIFLPPASNPDWFDKATGYPLTSKDYVTDRYINPWDNTPHVNGQIFTFPQFLSWRFQRLWRRSLNRPSSSSPLLMESSAQTDISSFQYEPADCPKKVKLSWLGHSSTLVEMHGLTILTDPHFSKRAGTTARYSPSPISDVDRDLPSTIDICVLSHDHYDHLDYETLVQLQHKVQYFVVPKGLKSWLMEEIPSIIPSHRIIELEWWQSVVLHHPNRNHNNSSPYLLTLQDLPLNPNKIGIDDSHHPGKLEKTRDVNDKKNKIVITCTPAQHYCSRTPFDRNRRLWCSFAITSFYYNNNVNDNDEDCTSSSSSAVDEIPHKLSFFFAGDTGMPTEFPLFRQIGDVLGPFHLAAIPIGAYLPKDYLKQSHCSPEEAVQMHQDLRSKKSVGIHWGTFDLADEDYMEPPLLLKKNTMKQSKIIDFTTIAHGGSIESDDQPAATTLLIHDESNDVHKAINYPPQFDITKDNTHHYDTNEILNQESIDIVEEGDDDDIITVSVVDSLEEIVTENDDVLTLLENDTYGHSHNSEDNEDTDYDDKEHQQQQQAF